MSGASGVISIHPAEIQAQAPVFGRESDQLAQALATLQRSLAALGEPWGGDKQGTEFAAAYTPQHDSIVKAIGVLVQGLESIHDGLNVNVANHVDGDAHIAGTIRAIQ